MRALLSSDGPLARVLPGFCEREAQLRMAESVAEVLEHGGHLVCEAGTGTGKSLAYLVPAAASGRRIVVSTATKALQGQLWQEDLPLAAAALGKPIRAELLKGRSNYVCKLHAGQVEARLFDVRHADALDRLRPWLQTTSTGDRAELDHSPPPALWAELAVGPDRCRGRRCPFVGECFSEKARQRAAEADVVLVNHALFFADLGLRRMSDGRVSILPDYDAVVFDEAHALEDYAAEWLGARVGSADLIRLQRDVERACELDDAPVPHKALIDVERHSAALFAALPAGPGRMRLRERHLRAIPPAAFDGLRAALAALAAGLGGGGGECARAARTAGRLALAGDVCLAREDEDPVVWSELGSFGSRVCSAPIDVGPLLREALWDALEASVLCSATLATGGDLSFPRRRLGLREAHELVLDPPFDYREQALLYVPAHAPDPR